MQERIRAIILALCATLPACDSAAPISPASPASPVIVYEKPSHFPKARQAPALASDNYITLRALSYYECDNGSSINFSLHFPEGMDGRGEYNPQTGKLNTILCDNEAWLNKKKDALVIPSPGSATLEINDNFAKGTILPKLRVKWKYSMRVEGDFPKGLKPKICYAELYLAGPRDTYYGAYHLVHRAVSLEVPREYEVLNEEHDAAQCCGGFELKRTWFVPEFGVQREVQVRRVEDKEGNKLETPGEPITLRYTVHITASAEMLKPKSGPLYPQAAKP